MKRGITFEIPNTYGNYLSDILEPLSALELFWSIEEQEIYTVQGDRLSDTLLFPNNTTIENKPFWERLEGNEYYIIFSDLKAYSTPTIDVASTYADFLQSNCQLVLLIADCTVVTIYCKNPHLLEVLYNQAIAKGFKNIEYITNENDARTHLSN
ncbi:DUF2691 family protein [Priestia sp. SB1]|uniref:DUF2691 family protein n=1 Tax=Priestia sp. SB1 TaxID=3132359 RepID=UPI00316D7E6E